MTGLALQADFPELNTSTLVRVADRLVALGLLDAEGDPHRYVGAVRYRPAGDALRLDPVIEDLRRATETLGLHTWMVGTALRIALPLSEIKRDLTGGSYSAFELLAQNSTGGSLDLLRNRLTKLVAQHLVEVEVRSEFSDSEGRSALVIGVAATTDTHNRPATG